MAYADITAAQASFGAECEILLCFSEITFFIEIYIDL